MPPAPAAASPWRIALSILVAIVFVLYPVLVWIGLSQGNPRTIAIVLLLVVATGAILKRSSGERAPALGVAAIPLVTIVALSLAAWLDAEGYMLAVPVAINWTFLVVFGITLRRSSTPMVERFALLQVERLSDEQKAWCRMWTWIWCGFFVVNGSAALALALFAPLFWWTLYTGLISYILMSMLFAIEWILRRRRFPEAPSRA